MVWPGTRPPVVTPAGTVAGIAQALPPMESQVLPVPHCAARQRAGRHPAGIAVFPAGGEDLAMHAGNADQDAEFVAPGVARDQRAALTQRAGIAVIAALRL